MSTICPPCSAVTCLKGALARIDYLNSALVATQKELTGIKAFQKKRWGEALETFGLEFDDEAGLKQQGE